MPNSSARRLSFLLGHFHQGRPTRQLRELAKRQGLLERITDDAMTFIRNWGDVAELLDAATDEERRFCSGITWKSSNSTPTIRKGKPEPTHSGCFQKSGRIKASNGRKTSQCHPPTEVQAPQ